MKKFLSFCLMSMLATTMFAQTATDIEISPSSGDITTAINNALSGGKVAKSITINLTAGASYTLSNPIQPGASLIINGAAGAVIDATNCMKAKGSGGKDDEEEEEESGNTAPFILMNSTPQISATSNFYRVEKILIKDVTLKGLKNSLFYDNKVPYCIVDFTIDNVVMQLATNAEADGVIAFKKGGYKDFTIKNSTVYGNNYSKLKGFINSKADLAKMGYDATKNVHNITYQNNTFVNVLATTKDEAWANDAFVGSTYVNYVVQNNIWYNCGLNIAIGLVGKDMDPAAKKLFSKNTYYNYDDKALAIKDQAVMESATDTSNDILTTDPTFADIANDDFHLHVGSLQAKLKTGDPRWLVAYDATKALPANIVLNLLKADNISDRLKVAKANLDKVGDITILLAMNAKYMLDQPIRSSGSVTITGENSSINCTKLTTPMIILEGTDSLAYNVNADKTKAGKNPNYKYVETVSLTGIKTTLKKYSTILKETQKTYVENVIIDDCVFELNGANNIFDFAGYPGNLEITNSTLWSEYGHKGHLLHTGGRVRDLDKSQNVLQQIITIDYCTLYQISVGVGFNDLAAKASRTLALTLTNSIIYNCTANGQEVKGWMGGSEADGPQMTYDKNTYWNNGTLQAGWIDENEALDGRDLTRTAFRADPGFYDVEIGDFAIANKSPQAQVPENTPQYGDPRWATWAAGDYYVATNFIDAHGSVSADKLYANEGTVITATVTPAEGFMLDTFTVTDALGNDIPLTDASVASARAASPGEESVSKSFTMPATGVTINVTFIDITVGIDSLEADRASARSVGKWYTLNGVAVEKPTKGIYIRDNKKVIIK
jgi:hypothetical protein